MGSRYVTAVMAVVLLLVFSLPNAHSQVIQATGNATEASSQLIYYYEALRDVDFPEVVDNQHPGIQVTNTNDTSGVWIHVKIFRTFNAGEIEEPVAVLCDERNFVDFLTPNDTHVYTFDEPNFPKNIGESEVATGESTALDLRETFGFVIITPVVSNTDLTAISFEHMIGTLSQDGGGPDARLNAMGRSAVDLTTGQKLADGTPLDGVTTGYVLLQPEELIFDFIGSDSGDSFIDPVGIVFRDVYGPPGLLGYQVLPGTATWTTFIFDFKESPTSCGSRSFECFLTLGLNDTLGQRNRVLNPPEVEDLLCAGSITPEHPTLDIPFFGWTRMFVSGLGDFDNLLGVVVVLEDNGWNLDGMSWMNTQK